MSYYRDREEGRPVSIRRYVIGSDDNRSREFIERRDDPYAGDRELVIRRKTTRDDGPMTVHRYEREVDYDTPARRDYERDYYEREYPEPSAHRSSRSVDYVERPEQPPAPIIIREQPVIVHEARNVYVSPRESEYDVVRRSDVDDDPHYHYRRRLREHDDRLSRRDLSPDDSISQASRRRSDRDQDYSSDDSMVYIRKETRGGDGDHPHHRRHLAEGALVGVGAAELIRSHRKREGEDVSHGLGHLGKTVGAGALGAVAVNAASHARDYYRSKSRHRSQSFDDNRYYHRSRHGRGHHSRSRSRSRSHPRAKTLLELGLGAAAVAGAIAAARNNSNKDERRSRSRTRSRSRGRAQSTAPGTEDARSTSQRRKHMAGAGLAGAAAAALIEHHRSRSRTRKGERPRSHSRLRQALPVVAAGLGTAAATGLYEKRKGENESRDGVSRERRHKSRSRSRGASEMYPDPTRDSAGLIEYGNQPVAGNIPAEHYYGQPSSPGAPYYSDPADGYNSRHRSHSRGARYGGNSSESDPDRRRRSKNRKHRSHSRELAEAALGATGLGYAAHKLSKRRERKKADKEHDRTRYDDNGHQDPYEEAYDPEPYPPSPQAGGPQPPDNYYPNTNYFPPPPGPTPTPGAQAAPYSPPAGDYPPPPGAAPPSQPYYGATGAGNEPFAPRPRRADENVSAALPTDQYHTRDGVEKKSSQPRSRSMPRTSHPSKSVAFNLGSRDRQMDRSHETDDSDSTIDSYGHRHSRYHRVSSMPHRPMPHPHPHRFSSVRRHRSTNSQTQTRTPTPSKPLEADSDSTIDLPDRFDAQGRLLTQREDDPAVARIEDFVNKFTRVLF